MKDKQSTSNVPIITRLKTQDIDELAEWARGWEQEHTQLQKGAFEWESCIIEIDGFQFIEELYGALILCRGKTPPETFVLGIPQLHGGESLYGGNTISENCCLEGNSDRYLDLRASQKTKLLMIVAPIERILACAEQMQCYLSREQLLSPGIMMPNFTALKQLSNYLEELLVFAKTYPDRLTDNSEANLMSRLIIEDSLPLLVDVLTSELNFWPEKKSNRQKLVNHAEAFMRSNLIAPITLSNLCQQLNTSPRSLYRVFQEYFGLPPMQYLKILRLHQVRRALKSANSRTSKVTELATSCGFWHMGQFSQDYKQMFGESPSITLKKNLGNFSGFQV